MDPTIYLHLKSEVIQGHVDDDAKERWILGCLCSHSRSPIGFGDLQPDVKVIQGHLKVTDDDARLNFSASGQDELCISNEMLNRIWWPDTFFANAKMAFFHKATTDNAFLRIKPSGFITQSLRYAQSRDLYRDLGT